MSVTPNQAMAFGSANMPEADSVTVGGAVDFAKRVAFFDITPAGLLDFVSSAAGDTAVKLQVAGRDSTGTIQTPAAITLNGTTKVAGTQSFERLLYGIITGAITGTFPLTNPGGTAATGDVAAMAHTLTITAHTAQVGSANTSGTTPPLLKLQAGDGATIAALTLGGLGLIIRTTGGTGPNQIRYISVNNTGQPYGTDFVAVNRDWNTLPDATTTYEIAQGFVFDVLPAGIGSQTPVTQISRCFATSQADIPGGAGRAFYEKVFVANLNTTIALTGAAIQIASDTPSLGTGPTLVTNGTTASGNPTLHFASVPSWVIQGLQIADSTSGSVIPANTEVVSTTGTTVVMSNNAAGAGVGNGDSITFSPSLDIALTKVLNDTATAATRQTLPANGDTTALTFVAQPSAVNVIASPGSLPSGAAPNTAGAQGVWLRLALPAGAPAYKGAADLRATGSTI